MFVLLSVLWFEPYNFKLSLSTSLLVKVVEHGETTEPFTTYPVLKIVAFFGIQVLPKTIVAATFEELDSMKRLSYRVGGLRIVFRIIFL